MKILKNKLFLLSIFVIIWILVFQIYASYSQNTRDTQSYVQVLSSEVLLNNEVISETERYILHPWDSIVTTHSWRALIEWGDGSLTRLGENTEIYIDAASVNSSRTSIEISFELLSGRTWSNVISFLWNDSSFTQKIEWLDAWVRGTVFDVDIDTWFIHVSEHIVELTDQLGQSILVSPERPFDISRWAFIELEEFIRSFQDRAWTEFNKVSDSQYRQKLLTELESSIDQNNPFLKIMEWFFPHYRILYELDTSEDFTRTEVLISKLSERARVRTLELVESRYQDFNFLHPSDDVLYARKIRYQEALLLLSDNAAFQQTLLERTLLDLQSSVNFWNTKEVEVITALLESYSNILPGIESSFVEQALGWIWEELWNEFQRTKNTLEEIFQIDFSEFSLESPSNILDTTSDTIQNFLEDNFWDTLRNFLR